MFLFFFFFSSRRRHTRCLSDWSSDVCSSDLGEQRHVHVVEYEHLVAQHREAVEVLGALLRSEERRVGKECRSRWWAEYLKKKKYTAEYDINRGRREDVQTEQVTQKTDKSVSR